MDWSSAFEAALPYAAFLDRHASLIQRPRWDAMHARIRLEAEQSALLGGFVRRMPVLVLAGAWCGDCVNQCTIFDHFAAASTVIDLRFLDRDALPEVADALSINGGRRVPSVLFLSEDFHPVARYGERTLSTYRRLAADQLGPGLPHRPGRPHRRRHQASSSPNGSTSSSAPSSSSASLPASGPGTRTEGSGRSDRKWQDFKFQDSC